MRSLKLSIREAARHYAISRAALTNALNSGKISGVRDDSGRWQIDPSELARVYDPRPSAKGEKATEPPEPAQSEPGRAGADTPLAAPEAGRIELLEKELARIRGELEIALLERDHAREIASERAAALADLRRLLPPAVPTAVPTTPPQDPPRSFALPLPRWFSRARR